MSQLRRENDDLKIEVLSLKERFHKEQIREQQLRQAQRASSDSTIASLQKGLQELKEGAAAQNEKKEDTEESLGVMKSELEVCRAVNASYGLVLCPFPLILRR